jgi:hypothetical protein
MILICIQLLSGCRTANQSSESTVFNPPNQIVNPDLVKGFTPIWEELEDSFRQQPFQTIQKIEVVENSDTLYLLLQQSPGWIDPGDFINLQIMDNSGNVILEQVNIDGWVKFGSNYFVPESVSSQNLIESDLGLLLDNHTGKQLVLFSWVYASDPGGMTIIDLFPTPTIIFNYLFDLKEVYRKADYLYFMGNTMHKKDVVLNTKEMIFE